MTKTKYNEDKNKMRAKVVSLYNYWQNIAKPQNYNVVSLPETNFDLEQHAISRVEPEHRAVIHMYEKNKQVWEANKNRAKNIGNEGDNFLSFYINGEIPPVSSFANLPTFAWYDYCGIPTTDKVENLLGEMANKSVLIFTFANRHRRREGLHPEIKNVYSCYSRIHTADFFRVKLGEYNLSHELFGFEYTSKATPMIMLAFTNCKTLASIYTRGNKNSFKKLKKFKDTDTSSNNESVDHIYRALLSRQNTEDGGTAYCMQKFNLRKMQVAGYKRTITHKGMVKGDV